nr:putative capsid [Marmot picobirnavirus]
MKNERNNAKDFDKDDSKSYSSNKGKKKNKRNTYRGQGKGSYQNREGNTRTERGNAKTSRYEDIHSNDIAWWNKSSLYALASNVQYNKMPGYIYDQSHLYYYRSPAEGGSLQLEGGFNQAYPGIAVVNYYPTLGKSVDSNSPVNLAFTSLFTELVAHFNSSVVNFQQMDLALITLAIHSIVNQIAELERALGLTNVYFRENAYYPKAIMEATGLRFDDVANQKGVYVLELQSLVQSFNAISVPDYLDLFKRAMQLGRNVYMDEDNIMGQTYMFRSNGYYIYEDIHSKLTYHDWDVDPEITNVELRLRTLKECIGALRNSEDLGNILGAVRRAFPDTALITLDIPTSADIILPVHDRNVTWQVNNLMATGSDVLGLDVTQDPVANILKCEPYIEITSDVSDLYNLLRHHVHYSGFSDEFIVNSYNGEIGPEFMMEATRLMYALQPFSSELADGSKVYKLATFGTEIVRDVTFYSLKQDPGGTEPYISGESMPSTLVFDTASESAAFSAKRYLSQAAMVSKFNNHPRLLMYTIESGTDKVPDAIGIFGDLNVFTTISESQLEYLNLAALQSVYLITTQGSRNI